DNLFHSDDHSFRRSSDVLIERGVVPPSGVEQDIAVAVRHVLMQKSHIGPDGFDQDDLTTVKRAGHLAETRIVLEEARTQGSDRWRERGALGGAAKNIDGRRL